MTIADPTPWLALLALEPSTETTPAPEGPKPIRIDPPRGRRHASSTRPWTVPRSEFGHAQNERPKTDHENELQGRLERDATPVVVLADDLLARARDRALQRATATEIIETIAGSLDPALHDGNPRLRNLALARALRFAGAKSPTLAEFFEAECAQRTSRHWASDVDEANAASWLDAYRAPPPPPPRRPEHAPAYVAAAKRVIDGAYTPRTFTPLAFRDPLDGKAFTITDVPGAPPASPFGAHEADFLLARVREGHALAFIPAGERLVPPDISAVKGATWTGAPDGRCYLLSVAL